MSVSGLIQGWLLHDGRRLDVQAHTETINCNTPPSNATVQEVKLPTSHDGQSGGTSGTTDKPKVSTQGSGITAVHVLESTVTINRQSRLRGRRRG